jgi:hypothetical protein
MASVLLIRMGNWGLFVGGSAEAVTVKILYVGDIRA